MIKHNVSSHCYLKDRRVWYELRFWIGMSSLARGENRLDQFLKMLPSTFQDHSCLPLKKATQDWKNKAVTLLACTGKHHHCLSWLCGIADGLHKSTEGRAAEAQGTTRPSFERGPGRSEGRADLGKKSHVCWVAPLQIELPPKPVGTAFLMIHWIGGSSESWPDLVTQQAILKFLYQHHNDCWIEWQHWRLDFSFKEKALQIKVPVKIKHS